MILVCYSKKEVREFIREYLMTALWSRGREMKGVMPH